MPVSSPERVEISAQRRIYGRQWFGDVPIGN
jgi:hypothetical protein